MSDQVIGIDVSHWQGRQDWAKALQAGARFGFARASGVDANGNLFMDSQIMRNRVEAPKYMPASYYHFFRPFVSGVLQADHFWGIVEGAARHFPLIVDVEKNRNGVPVQLYQDRLYEFQQRIQVLSGQVATTYTRGWFWNNNLGNPGWAPGGSWLWIARYTSKAHPWADDDRLRPWPWGDWIFWQYSADGNGQGATYGAESNDIDLNRFRHDLATLIEWTGFDYNVPDPPGPPDLPELPSVRLTPGIAALNVRSQPWIGNNRVAVLLPGQVAPVAHYHQAGADFWVQVVTPGQVAGWSAFKYQGATYLEFV